MLYEFASALDAGRLRSNNEDAVAVMADASLLVLADGMGGYNAGEVASQMATGFIAAELGRWLEEAGDQASDDDIRRAMDICADNANRAIFNAANSTPQYAGMGTTLVVMVLRAETALIGHVGDSRCYRLRDGVLSVVTKDHSLLQEQLDAGLITPAQAAQSTNRNLVTRAVGVEDTVVLDTQAVPVQEGDLFLLCSDGLNDMIGDEAIARTLIETAERPLQERCNVLIAAANAAGGKDNISVILARRLGAAAGPERTVWWPFRRP